MHLTFYHENISLNCLTKSVGSSFVVILKTCLVESGDYKHVVEMCPDQ